MSFQQVYYTSCTTGLRGGRGFQVNAATPGLAPATLQQVERLGLYVPPVSAPLRPTPEQIAGFPVALLYNRLADQGAVVLQSRYTGTDYSGRFGNYFAHSLVTARPEEDFDGLPIELWRSPLWCTQESPSTTLGPLESAPASGEVNPSAVLAFLRENDRMGHLPAFLTAVEQALKTRRRVIVVEHCDAIALWIAVASYALPRHHALRLTFTTYLKNPYQSDALITGTSSDSDFRFAPHELDRQFFVFDFLGRRFTRIPEPSEYARRVTELYARGLADDVAAFSRPESVPPDVGLEELAAALGFHATASGARLAGVSDAAVLQWSAGHLARLDPDVVEKLLRALLARPDVAPEVLAATGALVTAARPLPKLRARIERPYARWLVDRFMDEASGPALRAVTDPIDLLPETRASVADARERWLKRVHHADDASRLAGLVALGERLDYLDASPDDLETLGHSALGPRLGHPEVLRVTRQTLATPGRDRLLLGLAGYLSAHELDPVVASVSAEPELSARLEALALELDAVGLLIRLVGARVNRQREDRLRALKGLMADLTGRGHRLLGAEIDLVVTALWGETPWSAQEAEEVLRAGLFDAKHLVRSSVPQRALAALAAGEVFGTDAARGHLAEAIHDAGLSSYLDAAAAALVNASRAAAAIHRGGTELFAGLCEALAHHRALEGAAAQRLFDLCARKLIDLRDEDRHLEILEGLLALQPERTVEVYGRALEQALAPGRGGADELAGRVFTLCTRLYARPDTVVARGAQAIRDGALDRAVRLRKDLLDQMDPFVVGRGVDAPLVQGDWEAWRQDRKGGVMNFFNRKIRGNP